MDAQKTGALIAQARRERGLTQKELSQAIHVSAQAVSKWERGLNFPDRSLLEPLGDCLGLTVSELLSGRRGEEPKEELLRDSLRLLLSQAGRKLRRWRRLAQACLGVLLVLALGAGFWFVKNHTELLPQPATVIVPRELSERDHLAARTAGNSSVYLFDLAAADGARHYQVQMELWTQEGLVRTWPAAEAYDPAAPRHQTLGFSYQKGEEPSTMETAETFHCEKELPYTGVTIRMDGISASEAEKIRLLEGVLAATEKRLNSYIAERKKANS